jgi:hypothetical protein
MSVGAPSTSDGSKRSGRSPRELVRVPACGRGSIVFA